MKEMVTAFHDAVIGAWPSPWNLYVRNTYLMRPCHIVSKAVLIHLKLSKRCIKSYGGGILTGLSLNLDYIFNWIGYWSYVC